MGAYLKILIGDSYTYTTNVSVASVAQNVEGSWVALTFKNDPAVDLDAAAILQLTTTASQITISNATITATANSSTTGALEPCALCFWDLRCNTSAGQVVTLDSGRATISHPGTRSTS